MGVRVPANVTRLNQRDMRPSAARSVEVACHPLTLISAFFRLKSAVSFPSNVSNIDH